MKPRTGNETMSYINAMAVLCGDKDFKQGTQKFREIVAAFNGKLAFNFAKSNEVVQRAEKAAVALAEEFIDSGNVPPAIVGALKNMLQQAKTASESMNPQFTAAAQAQPQRPQIQPQRPQVQPQPRAPKQPSPRTEPPAPPPLSITPKHVSPRIEKPLIEKPLVEVVRRMVDHAAIKDAEKRTGTSSSLFNPKCKVHYDEITNKASLLQPAHKGLDGKDVAEREVFSMTESRITTAPAPSAADMYLSLKEASKFWPDQKLVIECSTADREACLVAAKALLVSINDDLKLAGKPPKQLNEFIELKREKKIEKTPDAPRTDDYEPPRPGRR